MLPTKKKIWIDLDNSPHVPFFKPIIEALHKRGYEVVVSARDAFQVRELADRAQMPYTSIGRHYGKNKMAKVVGLFGRALQLAPLALREKPVIAVSHGARSQIIISSILKIPTILIGDYEYVKHLPLMHPTVTLVPDIIPDDASKSTKVGLRKYPGIKEDVYVPSFEPDSAIQSELGLLSKEIVVTLRPPATEAHYHNPESETLFLEVMNLLGNHDQVKTILLPRNKKQADWISTTWSSWLSDGKVMIPSHALDGLNLIWFSDLVISGGGTMNREAAALGVPVYSIFRGKIGAVDRYLSEEGRLTLLENVDDVRTKVKLVPRHKPASIPYVRAETLQRVVDEIVAVVEGSGS